MQPTDFKIDLLNWQLLEHVPSASGVVKVEENFYVIGDNSPYLFCLDSNLGLLSKTRVHWHENLVNHAIPKIEKPDFEAIARIGEKKLMILGSGSRSPERDVCIIVQLAPEIRYKSYTITSFYDALRTSDALKDHELDIEGLAFDGHLLYLFNRGKNLVFSMPYQAFINYCKTGANAPTPQVKAYHLPKINGVRAGFTGATFYKPHNLLIFTAAVEDAPNAYDDGPILGSFIGVIEIKNGHLSDTFIIKQIPNPSFPLKVEGITVDKILSGTQINLVLVTDNDGKASEALKIQMALT